MNFLLNSRGIWQNDFVITYFFIVVMNWMPIANSYNEIGQDYNDNSNTLYNSVYYSPDLSGKFCKTI